MVIAIDDRNTGPVTDAMRGRRALPAVLLINLMILKRAKLAGNRRLQSFGPPVAIASVSAGASA